MILYHGLISLDIEKKKKDFYLSINIFQFYCTKMIIIYDFLMIIALKRMSHIQNPFFGENVLKEIIRRHFNRKNKYILKNESVNYST